MQAGKDDHIFWRDEVLQLIFWMAGEGLGDSPAAGELARFLSTDEVMLAKHLGQMIEDGYLTSAGGRFSLTPFGKTDGGRRFREEFDSMLNQGHAECNDPDCDCHQMGPEHCHSRVA